MLYSSSCPLDIKVFIGLCDRDVHMQAAQSAGILAAAVPPALSARGVFNNADVTFDGFGPGGGVTWRRLEAVLAKANGEQ